MRETEQASLLKRFEPILKFTQGERFFPYDVADYVHQASLWVKPAKEPAQELVPEEDLDLDALGSQHLKGIKKVHYLHFITPANLREMAEFRVNELRDALKNRDFQPTRSRLARVGYLARVVDVIFSLLLLLRGRVPGDSMTAAVITFNKMLNEKREFKYYGRVIHQSSWIILQYWYFYPFNNWRSGFFGANDHEADWEMVNIYCYRDHSGEVQPAWVGYASHNFSGEDLRRHWENADLEKEGEHPVVYVGGGSHASYFRRGEYLTQLTLPFLRNLKNTIAKVDKFFSRIFREERSFGDDEGSRNSFFTIPFVDYALGDGLSIGPGCKETWAPPTIIQPEPDWVRNYRGLWGYYAQDPFSGEDAPAGPRYNRNGTVRHAWFDPLGWAGMEKVIPPTEYPTMLNDRIGSVQSEIQILSEEVDQMQTRLYANGVELSAIQDVPHLQSEVKRLSVTLEENREILADKRRSLTVMHTKLAALERERLDLAAGKTPPHPIHTAHLHQPQIKRNLRFSGLAEVWAAVSIGVMMIAVVLLIVFARQFLLVGLVSMLLVMITVESAFRRRLAALVRSIAIVLAVGGFLILLFEFFWVFVLVIVMIIGFYMIIENLRELFARQ